MDLELAYQSPQAPPGFTPRTGRLITAGVLLLLAACLCGCMTTMLPLALLNPQVRGNGQGRQLIVTGLLYVSLTLALGTLGIGTLLPRRWARPLVLILTTHWLIAGVLSTLGSLLFLPVLLDMLHQQGGGTAPPGMVAIIVTSMATFMIVGFVAWPLVILLLMKGDEVRQTVEWRDPVSRWTDRCPINILGLSLTLIVAAALVLMTGLQAVVPIMGILLRGPLALLLTVGLAAVLGLAALKVYRLEPAGWWIGLLAVVLPLLAYVPNGWLISLADFYTALGMQPAQFQPMLRHEAALRAMMIGFPLFFAAGFSLYMIRLRPAFIAAAHERSRSAAA